MIAAQIEKFYKEVFEKGYMYFFCIDSKPLLQTPFLLDVDYLGESRACFPFWSSVERMKRIKELNEDFLWGVNKVHKLPLDDFFSTTLPQIFEKKWLLSLNLCGEGLKGADLEPEIVLKSFIYRDPTSTDEQKEALVEKIFG